jgi:hypothetical protein
MTFNVTHDVFDEEEADRDVVDDVHGEDGLLILGLMAGLLLGLKLGKSSQNESHRRDDHHAQRRERHGLKSLAKLNCKNCQSSLKGLTCYKSLPSKLNMKCLIVFPTLFFVILAKITWCENCKRNMRCFLLVFL